MVKLTVSLSLPIVQDFLFHLTLHVIVHNIQYFFRNPSQNYTINDKYSSCIGVKRHKTCGGEPTCHVCNQKYELSYALLCAFSTFNLDTNQVQ